MKHLSWLLVFSLAVALHSHSLASRNESDDGLIRLKSPHTVETTINRLETILKDKGMTIFKRISHSKGASLAGLELRDTELLIFGNPKVGTPLMMCEQSAAIDLPQKALAYKDESGQVWLTYNDPEYIQKRHNIERCGKVIEKIKNALSKFSAAAISDN